MFIRVAAWIVLLMIMAALLCTCKQEQPNTNPPAYIKDVVAYKEGIDGIAVYFVLADESGAPTSAWGFVSLTISELSSQWTPGASMYREKYEGVYDYKLELYSTRPSDGFQIIEPSNFYVSEVGLGDYQRELLLYSFGRITYSELVRQPQEGSELLIEVSFTHEDFSDNPPRMLGETSMYIH